MSRGCHEENASVEVQLYLDERVEDGRQFGPCVSAVFVGGVGARAGATWRRTASQRAVRTSIPAAAVV